jgi:hypothetical protein
MNGGIINSITRLHLVGYFYWVILRCTNQWILKIPSLKCIGNSVEKNYNECGVLWDNKPCLFIHDILTEEGRVQNYVLVLWFEKFNNGVCAEYAIFPPCKYAVHYLLVALLTGDNGICIQKQILHPYFSGQRPGQSTLTVSGGGRQTTYFSQFKIFIF